MAISVIIPCYNVETYLPRSIHSVLAQTVNDWELLIVDDNSERDITPFVPHDPRIRIIRLHSNQGASAVRNAGIRASRGEIVAFLDADDYWLPQKLASQIALIRSAPEVGFVFTDFRHELADGSSVDWQGGMEQRLQNLPQRKTPLGVVYTESLAPALIELTSFMHPSTMVARRSVLENAGMFDESYRSAEDLELWIRLARTSVGAMVPRVLAHIEQRSSSVGHNHVALSINMLRLYKELLRSPEAAFPSVRAVIIAQLIREHRTLGWAFRQQRDKPSARAHYLAAFRLSLETADRLSILKTYLPFRA